VDRSGRAPVTAKLYKPQMDVQIMAAEKMQIEPPMASTDDGQGQNAN
jgi:hypothetical protein